MATEFFGSAQIAARFTKALYDLSKEQNQLDRIADELDTMRQAIEQDANMQALIRNPLLKREDQEAAITAILKQSGASDIMVKFAGLLAEKRRLNLFPQIIKQFDRMVKESRGEITAEVTSARPLTDAQMQGLQQSIGQMMGGKKIAIHTTIDPDILGGVVVRLGSTMIDSSLQTKLNNLSLALKGAA